MTSRPRIIMGTLNHTCSRACWGCWSVYSQAFPCKGNPPEWVQKVWLSWPLFNTQFQSCRIELGQCFFPLLLPRDWHYSLSEKTHRRCGALLSFYSQSLSSMEQPTALFLDTSLKPGCTGHLHTQMGLLTQLRYGQGTQDLWNNPRFPHQTDIKPLCNFRCTREQGLYHTRRLPSKAQL